MAHIGEHAWLGVASEAPGPDGEVGFVMERRADPHWLVVIARRSGFALSAACLVAAALRAGVFSPAQPRRAASADVRASMEADEVLLAPALAPQGEQWWTNIPGTSVAAVVATTTTLAAAGGTVASGTPVSQDWFDALAGGAGVGTPLAPRATLNDGNVCGDDEEELNNLCYKKCTSLTDGGYPIRTSAWTCCKSTPCTFLNQKHDVGVCSGFDVAGDVEGQSACPHTAGACLNDEELHLGMCYKKCSILAPKYPIRFSPATCCNTNGLTCALPGNSVTSQEYAVGGGGGDGDSSTPSEVHMPLTQLTESD
mmetsp:Transcript_165147/g.530032  ORF Transcript_165147/g.530032 Transcript_165147/m.530032 type:complete len:311 (-) Transcript_165147:45-977(-)